MDFQSKIKLALENSNLEDFCFKESLIAGDECILVTPNRQSVEWNIYNVYLRSVIYRKSDFYPVSLGFFKFANWGEKPDVFPVPSSLDDSRAVLKLDGSLLCLSSYKGQAIIRSRGTFDFYQLDNGHEIDILKKKYPKVFKESLEKPDYSFIYEFVTPSMKIVIDYPEPDIYLIGVINHKNYSLISQGVLDIIANNLGVKRPEYFKFDSIADMLRMVKDWEGKEGIVLYSNRGQELTKIKADKYLTAHYFKSTCNFNSLFDLFFEFGCPEDISVFESLLIKNFDCDYETLKMAKLHIENILDSYKLAKTQVSNLMVFVNEHRDLEQKLYAQKVLTEHKKYSSFLFQLRKLGKLDNSLMRKLMELNN